VAEQMTLDLGGTEVKKTPRSKRTPLYQMREAIAVRLQIVRDSSVPYTGDDLSNPEAVAKLLSAFLAGADREHFVAISLDPKNKVAAVNTVSIGTLTSTLVHPREVFKHAVRANAHAVIVGHNHPSGDPTPSKEDREATRRLKAAGEILGIELLDHVVVADGGRYKSLRQLGCWS